MLSLTAVSSSLGDIIGVEAAILNISAQSCSQQVRYSGFELTIFRFVGGRSILLDHEALVVECMVGLAACIMRSFMLRKWFTKNETYTFIFFSQYFFKLPRSLEVQYGSITVLYHCRFKINKVNKFTLTINKVLIIDFTESINGNKLNTAEVTEWFWILCVLFNLSHSYCYGHSDSWIHPLNHSCSLGLTT